MPFYSLRDHTGRELATVMAESAAVAAASSRARSLPTFHEAVPSGTGRRSAPADDDAAESRLMEAFGRLGLSPRGAAQATAGRDGQGVDRLLTRTAADGLRAQVLDVSDHRRRGAWGDAKRRLADARMAGALQAVGYSLEDAAAIGDLLLPEPAATSSRASGPIPAAESARAAALDSESVPLLEVETRLGDALGRAFHLTPVEARHAVEGRSR